MLPNIAALLPARATLLIFHGLGILILLAPTLLLRKHQGQTITKLALWVNLGIQSLLFLLALGQGANLFGVLYPVALRALSLVGLLWLAKALFLEKDPDARLFVIGVSLVLALAGIFSFVRWLPLFTTQAFNQTRFDSLWAWLGILVAVAIPVAVWLRRPRALTKNELIIYSPFAAAWLLHGFTLRLSTTPWALLALTLLGLGLFSWHAAHKAAPVITVHDVAEALGEPNATPPMLDLVPQADPAEAQRALSKHMAGFLNADICALVERNPNAISLKLSEAFDLIREEHLSNFDLRIREVPALVKALETGAPFSANTPLEAVRERKAILETLAFNRIGNLLFFPLALKDQQAGLLFLSPYTEREFQQEDLERLNGVRNAVENMLKQSANLKAADQARQVEQAQAQRFYQDHVALGLHIDAQEANLIDLTHTVDRLRQMGRSDPERWQDHYEALSRQMELLLSTIQKDEVNLAHAQLPVAQKSKLESAMRRNARHLRALRQTLDSIKQASERAPEIAEEHSVEIADIEPEPEIEPAPAEEHILQAWLGKFAQKQVQIEEEIDPSIPEELLQKPLLRSVLDQLLSNALAASPVQGKTLVRIFENQLPDLPRMVAIQVTDQGGGLSTREQEHFIKFAQAAGYPAPVGIGDSVAIRQAIRTTRDMGGNWDIASDPGKSTTYCLSLPLEQVAS